jgi:hypothetical protein
LDWQNVLQENGNLECEVQVETNSIRNSSRNKKIPVTRSSNFFMNNLIANQSRLSSNAVRLPSTTIWQTSMATQPNYDKSIVEHGVVNDPSHTHHKKFLKIFHQNISDLRNKHNELVCHLSHDCPHILCLSEHHLNEGELQLIHFTDYLLGAKYCRKSFLKGGVCNFVAKNLKYKTINLDKYNIDKDIETCAIQLDLSYKWYVF